MLRPTGIRQEPKMICVSAGNSFRGWKPAMEVWASIFEGKYLKVEPQKLIEYILDDDRKVQVRFEPDGNKTKVTEVFEAEQENTVELQETGWQAILDNFKKYVEASEKKEKSCIKPLKSKQNGKSKHISQFPEQNRRSI